MTESKMSQNSIQHWPKVDLHCHLEGAIRPATLLELYRQNGGRFARASLEELLPWVQVTGAETSLFDFLNKFQDIMPALQREADWQRATVEAIEDAWQDGVIYLELRFCPHFIAEFSPLKPHEAVEAVLAGKESAERRFPIKVELILIVPQYGGEQIAEEALELAQAYRSRGVQALDVAGDIRQLGLDIYVPVFRRAASDGLQITLHAGEVTPAGTVRLAVEDMFASRIGHGIRSVDDPGVMRMLIERGVLLEVCVSSNLQTRAAQSLAEHPIHRLLEAGVPLCVNTDDPGISRITLTSEYELLQKEAGYTAGTFKDLNLQAIQAAFTTPEVKSSIRSKLEAYPWE
jgi:adenosine deaminase